MATEVGFFLLFASLLAGCILRERKQFRFVPAASVTSLPVTFLTWVAFLYGRKQTYEGIGQILGHPIGNAPIDNSVAPQSPGFTLPFGTLSILAGLALVIAFGFQFARLKKVPLTTFILFFAAIVSLFLANLAIYDGVAKPFRSAKSVWVCIAISYPLPGWFSPWKGDPCILASSFPAMPSVIKETRKRLPR